MENFWTYFEVLAPSLGVGLVFWLAIRSIFRADRKERAMEAEVRDELQATHSSSQSDGDHTEDAASRNGSPRPTESGASGA